MIKVLYYYYYLFYTKILPDDQPHATVIFTLSFSQSLLINGLINIILAYFAEFALSKYQMIIIFVLIMGINFFVFYRKKKAQKMVMKHPKFFNNHTLSIVITILFFLITTSFLFWEPDLVRNILESR